MVTAQTNDDVGIPFFALISLAIGAATGLGIHLVSEVWINDTEPAGAQIATLLGLGSFTTAFLLLVSNGTTMRALIGAVLITALLAIPDWRLTALIQNADGIDRGIVVLWFGCARWLTAYLLVVLVRSTSETGIPPKYDTVFLHGLTTPLIVVGAFICAGLALLLVYAWAQLMKEMGIDVIVELLKESAFYAPFLGAITAVAITMMRAQRTVLSAMRFLLLLFSRIAMPISAVFTLTFFAALAVNGTEAVFDRGYPSATMIGVALFGMLIFNGVYQNGEGKPPALWLRASTLITLLGFPVYSALAFYGLTIRIEDYGLTPMRIAGLAFAGLIATYAVICIVALLSEVIRWGAKKWMAPVGAANTFHALLWIVVIYALAFPLVNPWAISAKSQASLLENETIAADNFDFSYLYFELGTHGREAADRLYALDAHPEIEKIRAEIDRARTANSRYNYDYPDRPVRRRKDDPVAETSPLNETQQSPEELEFNPDGAFDEIPENERGEDGSADNSE